MIEGASVDCGVGPPIDFFSPEAGPVLAAEKLLVILGGEECGV